MKKTLISLIVGLTLMPGFVFAQTVFNSNQVGTGAVNGYYLETVGANSPSIWAPVSGGGGSGGSLFLYLNPQNAYYAATSTAQWIVDEFSTTTKAALEVNGGIFANSSSTIELLTSLNSTSTNATTTNEDVAKNLTIGSLSGVLKGTSGLVSTAANGTDYTLLTAANCAAGTAVTVLTASGGSTCANAFSTTSAAYWQTQNNFFSTTSANYWSSQGLGFSTTSSAYWLTLNQGNAFSTTSANYWGGQQGYLTGNQTITLSGDVTGSGATAITTTLKNTGTGAGSCTNCSATFDAQGRETAYSNGTAPLTSLTATWPIISSGGTTPNLTYGGLGSSTNLVLGQVPYSTGVNTFGQEATGTITCTGSASCGAGSYVLGNSLTINATGGSGGSGNVSTSTHENAGQVAYWTSNSATPALLGEEATSSITCINGQVTACATGAYVLGSPLVLNAQNLFSTTSANYWGGTQGYLTSAVTSLAQTYGTGQTGAVTLGTSSTAYDGLTFGDGITNSGAAFTFKPIVSGTLTVAGGGTGLSTIGASSTIAFSNGSTLNYMATGTTSFFSLTTTGSSGASTYSNGTLNIPQYSAGGSGQSVTFASTSGTTITANTTLGSTLVAWITGDIPSNSCTFNMTWNGVPVATNGTGNVSGGPNVPFSLISQGVPTTTTTVIGLTNGGCNTFSNVSVMYEAVTPTSNGGFAYPFVPTNNYSSTNEATTGIIWEQNGINASSTSNIAYASTTAISSSNLTNGDCVQAGTGGLLISAAAACGSGSGGTNTNMWATSTSPANAIYTNINQSVGIASSSPWAILSVGVPVYSATAPMFAIGSSTSSGTTTPFIVSANGYVGVATTTPTTGFASGAATSTLAGDVVTGTGSTAAFTVNYNGSASLATTSQTGVLNIGPDSGSATTTIEMGKIQIDGYSSTGSRVCAEIVVTSWVITAGACTP